MTMTMAPVLAPPTPVEVLNGAVVLTGLPAGLDADDLYMILMLKSALAGMAAPAEN